MKIGTVLKLTKKNFKDEELTLELFPTIRQTVKIYVIANSMSTDKKLSKDQILNFLKKV